MCGICGFAGLGDRADLGAMTAALAHRGPDDQGCWSDEAAGVHLGHRRLAVIDPAGGAQPMWTADRSLGVVYNGAIYNAPALRRELERAGHRFASDHADTEVLLYGYRQWGTALAGRLNGMWAFALYDRARRRLFLSRDRFGQKPLFYTVQRGTLAFASETRALRRHRGLRASVDPLGLKKFFAHGFIPSPGTLYREIRSLPAGCQLDYEIGSGRLRQERYWRFEIEPDDGAFLAGGTEQLCATLRERLAAAVQRRMMADVPLGLLLSGGIDSAALAAMAARSLRGRRLRTFTVGFDAPSFDESPHARRVARHCRTDHHPTTVSLAALRRDLDTVVRRLDEPLGDSSLLPTFVVCREARRHVTVALAGDGGDELFAGYDPFRALQAAACYRRWVPKPLHAAVRLVVSRLPVSHRYMSLDFRLKRTLAGLDHPPRLWNPVWLAPLSPCELSAFFEEDLDPEEIYAEAIAIWDDCRQRHPVDRTLAFYTRLYLPDDILVKADRASMLNGLELRAPFLDIELVDFVRRVPHRFKLHGLTTKYLLRRALAPLLPSDTLHRAKQGFALPVGGWLKAGAVAFEPDRLPAGPNRSFAARRLAEHRRGRRDDRLFLWCAWVLSRMGGLME